MILQCKNILLGSFDNINVKRSLRTIHFVFCFIFYELLRKFLNQGTFVKSIWHPLWIQLSVMDPSWNNSNFFQRLTTHQKGRGSPYQGGEDCHQPESKILPRDKKAVSPVQEGTEGNLLSRRSFSLIEYPYNVSDNHKSTMKE